MSVSFTILPEALKARWNYPDCAQGGNVGLIDRLAGAIAKKQKKAVYYWAGFGDNPLKELGVRDWKRN